MKYIYTCEQCSNRCIELPVGFNSVEHSTCLLIGEEVELDDGCTFGNSSGPTNGYVPYDIDLSMTTNYQEKYYE